MNDAPDRIWVTNEPDRSSLYIERELGLGIEYVRAEIMDEALAHLGSLAEEENARVRAAAERWRAALNEVKALGFGSSNDPRLQEIWDIVMEGLTDE